MRWTCYALLLLRVRLRLVSCSAQAVKVELDEALVKVRRPVRSIASIERQRAERGGRCTLDLEGVKW